MSPPRFLVLDLPSSGDVALGDTEARHAANVLRLGVGDEVILFNGSGGEALAVVEQVQKRHVMVTILNRTDTDRELPCRLEVYAALPKGDRQRTMIDGLVQLGVTKLTPLDTQRGVAQPSSNAIQRLERAVIETSKQCGRNALMQIGSAIPLSDLAATLAEPNTLSLLAHPYGKATALAEVQRDQHCRVAVGPEGGFTDEECLLLAQAGWLAVTLGPRILRIEFAAMLLAGWWGSKFGSAAGRSS